jgi:LCP family protein required for cell wall assembly
MGRKSSRFPSGINRSVLRAGHSRRGAHWHKALLRFLIVVVGLGVIVGLIGGAILLYLQVKVKGGDEEVENLTPQAAAEPMNVLVLGSDSRDDLTEEQRISFGTIGGRRADTIMLLHLDERRQKVVLVHFPRDLRVQDPEGKQVKLNGVYGQGADAVVSTISAFTGLPIHHYLEVDFNGFNRITQELGGVKVYFEKPINDIDSGLDVPRGCVAIEGEQALAFVRARKIDDDFGRIRRQQLFLKLMADKIAKPGTLLRPDKVLSLVNVFSSTVKHDADLTLGDIKTIGLRLRSFNSTNLDMRVVPSSGARIQGVEYVVSNEAETRALFSAIAERKALPPFGRTGVSAIDPSDVRVSLLNGTSVDKLAATEADVLKSKGFQVFVDGNAPAHEKTTVYFAEGYEEQGRLLLPIYPATLVPKPQSLVSQAEVALVLGKDFADSKAASGATPAPVASTPALAQPPAPAAPAPVPETKPLVRACDQGS